jgi:hypothetical protein
MSWRCCEERAVKIPGAMVLRVQVGQLVLLKSGWTYEQTLHVFATDDRRS